MILIMKLHMHVSTPIMYWRSLQCKWVKIFQVWNFFLYIWWFHCLDCSGFVLLSFSTENQYCQCLANTTCKDSCWKGGTTWLTRAGATSRWSGVAWIICKLVWSLLKFGNSIGESSNCLERHCDSGSSGCWHSLWFGPSDMLIFHNFQILVLSPKFESILIDQHQDWCSCWLS
jgi:hypothetical protein